MIRSPSSCFLISVWLLLIMHLGASHSKHRHSYCHPDGPPIQFPFKLINGNDTDQSGFGLSCSNNNTILQIPAVPDPIRLSITAISYENQWLAASDTDNCLPKLFLRIYNTSIRPFRFDLDDSPTPSTNITFFDCSSVGSRQLRNEYQTFSDAQDMISCPIYAADSYESVVELDLVSCTKMFDVALLVTASSLRLNDLYLGWSKPKPAKISTPIILAASGSVALVLVLATCFYIYRYFRMRGEDQTRVEKFLEDYRAFKPTRFSYVDIKRITNRFKEKLGEGTHGVVFKGRLSNEILVAVKILNNTDGDGKEFINEVGTMGKIHHVNVVRLLGFCADGFHRALVYDYFPNGSLDKFISPPDNKEKFLGWQKLQNIALGIAKGINYLHQGCDHQILHFDINPRNVLLDDNFAPKITDFGLAKLCSKNQNIVSMTTARGTLGYIAPEVFSRNFGNVSYKSDIYSYGILLLELVGGRKNIDTSTKESFQVLYPDWIHNLLDAGDMHIDIDDEGVAKIAKKLAIVGLWCIQWHSIDRPSMKVVLQLLEGEADKLKMPPNPFNSSASNNASTITATKRLNLELEVIHELN